MCESLSLARSMRCIKQMSLNLKYSNDASVCQALTLKLLRFSGCPQLLYLSALRVRNRYLLAEQPLFLCSEKKMPSLCSTAWIILAAHTFPGSFTAGKHTTQSRYKDTDKRYASNREQPVRIVD
jgi:hypothetical protein